MYKKCKNCHANGSSGVFFTPSPCWGVFFIGLRNIHRILCVGRPLGRPPSSDRRSTRLYEAEPTMIMIIKIFLVYCLINTGTSDESNRGLNAPDLPTNSTLESTAATPAKRKNLATSDGNSPGKPRGFTVSPRSKKLRSPGGRGQIVWVSPGSMGRMWRTYVPEEADDNERNRVLKKRQRAELERARRQR